MREILFRGRMPNGQWVYGFYKGKNDIHKIWCSDGYWYDIAPVTLGQFTGLTDKNGEKIFEGDILQAYDDTDVPMFLCKVEYCDKHHYPAFEIEPVYWEDEGNNLQILVLGLEDCYCRVIGNMFDNPELLEVANE